MAAKPDSCSGFKLHCFPDITASAANPQRQAGSDRDRFKRVIPGSGHCGCDAFGAGSEESGKDLSAEEAEQIGYQRGYCEGEQQGLARGEETGFKKGRQAVDPLIAALKDVLQELDHVRTQTYRSVESEIVALALAIARKIVGQELSIKPDLVLTVVRKALGPLEAAGRVRIKLSPADLDMLNEVSAAIAAELPEPGRVKFEADDSIACGGCVIETDAGQIDARLATQFQVIEESFRQEMSRLPSGV